MLCNKYLQFDKVVGSIGKDSLWDVFYWVHSTVLASSGKKNAQDIADSSWQEIEIIRDPNWRCVPLTGNSRHETFLIDNDPYFRPAECPTIVNSYNPLKASEHTAFSIDIIEIWLQHIGKFSEVIKTIEFGSVSWVEFGN